MRHRFRQTAMFFFLLALEFPSSQIEVFPPTVDNVVRVHQGEAILVQVKGSPESLQEVKAEFLGTRVSLVQSGDLWLALLGVDMDRTAGDYQLDLRLKTTDGQEKTAQLTVAVVPRDYGVERLSLPPDKVELSAEALARVQADQQALARAWSTPSPERYWTGIFLRPVPGEVKGFFGQRRIINDQPKSPHSGQDLRAKLGEPVQASNAGRVVLVRDCFFSGNSVVLDHGLGLYSMYFHLSEVKVKEGELVQKGQVIGLAGMTGRATGPHLHWGFRLLGARVDPEAILALPLP